MHTIIVISKVTLVTRYLVALCACSHNLVSTKYKHDSYMHGDKRVIPLISRSYWIFLWLFRWKQFCLWNTCSLIRYSFLMKSTKPLSLLKGMNIHVNTSKHITWSKMKEWQDSKFWIMFDFDQSLTIRYLRKLNYYLI